MLLKMFYPTSETELETNRTQAMLFDSVGDPLTNILQAQETTATGTIPTNMNITNTLDTPAALSSAHPHSHGHNSVQTLPCFNDLIAVLIECFALIAIGYLSGRFRLISSDAKDISAYLTTFALPMIIFLNVAQMQISTINLSFLACMLVSKLLLFVVVTVITLAISYPANFSYAGALSILATQSNDFALGYPLFKSLYGESKPEMLSYLNLMGPIQLLIINPLGIVMLEFGKARANRTLRRRANSIVVRKKCAHCLQGSRHGRSSPPTGQQQQQQTAPMGNESQTDEHNYQVAQRIPTRRFSSTQPVERLNDMQRKNIKSLTLVMPALVLSSEDSFDQVSDYYFCQSRARENDLTSCDVLNSSPDSSRSCNDQQQQQQQQHATPLPTKPKLSNPRNVEQPLDELAHQRSLSDQLVTLDCALAEHQQQSSQESKCTCWNCGPDGDCLQANISKEPIIDLSFVKALLTNPLIIASVVALAVNLIHGPELPKFVTKVSNTIAASFAAPALFVVGISMYGKFKLIVRNPNDLLLSSVLVLTKVFILPNIMRTVMLIVLPHYAEPDEIPYLADFSYLYGQLPTAPGACIIAKQYEILTNVVSICMLLSTFISAPMMLGTSAIISQVSATTPETILNIIAQTLRVSSSVTLTLSFLTLYMLWKSNRRLMSSLDRIMRNVAELKATHVFTFLLALTQLVIGIGGFLWLFVDTSKLKQQNFLDLMARDGSLLSASSANNGDLQQWPRDDVDDFLDEDEQIYSNSGPADAQSAHSFMIEPNSQAIGFGALCTMKYVLSSGGILMARFIILCIVVTNFAKHFRGHQLAIQVSSLMLKIFTLFGIGVILCLVFESHHLSCLPTESSLPTWKISLYLRLIFNSVLLLLAVPLFTATFRLSNKLAWFEAQTMQEVSGEMGGASVGSLKKRRFVTSSASLSSDTSSAITTSTNLDAAHLGHSAHNEQLRQRRTSSVAQSGDNKQIAQKSTDLMSHRQSVDNFALNSTVLLIDYEQTKQQRQQSEQTIGTINAQTSSCSSVQRNSDTLPVYQQATYCSPASGGNSKDEQQNAVSSWDGKQFQTRAPPSTLCDTNNNFTLPPKSSARLHDKNDAHYQNNQLATGEIVGRARNIPTELETQKRITPQSNVVTVSDLATVEGEGRPRVRASTPPSAASMNCANTANNRWPHETEFNKYSILIVFMLFQALVSLTSIIQLLNQDKPSGGTFVMGEITNVAIDFGQGLVTFLVIGSQSYLKGVISSFSSSMKMICRCLSTTAAPPPSQTPPPLVTAARRRAVCNHHNRARNV